MVEVWGLEMVTIFFNGGVGGDFEGKKKIHSRKEKKNDCAIEFLACDFGYAHTMLLRLD